MMNISSRLSCKLQATPHGASVLRVAHRVPALPPRLPARRLVLAAAEHRSVLSSVEARLGHFIAELSGDAAGKSSRVPQCILSLLLLLQRLIRWVQLAAVALQLHKQQQQLVFAGAATAAGGSDASIPLDGGFPAATAPPAQWQQQQPSTAVMGFLSAATSGAVEQLRYTLTDASQGIESKLSALDKCASSVQDTLFRAAQAHSEAVRSNPQGGMWKQPCVDSVISEEERLRQAVFEQVYAELLLKDNKDISFNAQQ